MRKLGGRTLIGSLLRTFTGGGASSIPEAATWDDRPLSPVDGDKFFFAGIQVVFRYHAAGGIWVPGGLHNEGIGDIHTIDGTEANDAALTGKGWTLTETNGGDITYDGTRVTFDSDGADNMLTNLSFAHTNGVTKGWVAYGRCLVTSQAGTGNNLNSVFSVRDGSQFRSLAIRAHTSDFCSWLKAGANTLGTTDANANILGVERFVMAAWIQANLHVAWVEHPVSGEAAEVNRFPLPTTLYQGTDFLASGGQFFEIGDLNSFSRALWAVRDFSVFSFDSV